MYIPHTLTNLRPIHVGVPGQPWSEAPPPFTPPTCHTQINLPIPSSPHPHHDGDVYPHTGKFRISPRPGTSPVSTKWCSHALHYRADREPSPYIQETTRVPVRRQRQQVRTNTLVPMGMCILRVPLRLPIINTFRLSVTSAVSTFPARVTPLNI
jgi:hypothetical protein